MSILTSMLKDMFFSSRQHNKRPHPAHYAEIDGLIDHFRSCLKSRNTKEALAIMAQLATMNIDTSEIEKLEIELEYGKHLDIVDSRFPGPRYLEWLQWFHANIIPKSYLEIGIESGKSLQYAGSQTRSVGIDPEFSVVHDQKNWTKLFRQTSDDFFATENPLEVFDTKSIDLSFIDGLHTFDQALKDFINIERFSDTKSIVLFHDIFPVIPVSTERNRNSVFWIGDTWKVMLILRQYRPDLTVFTIPTHPSGLGVVTGLNRDSTVLSENYAQIVKQMMALKLEELPRAIEDHLNVTQNDYYVVAQQLSILEQQ